MGKTGVCGVRVLISLVNRITHLLIGLEPVPDLKEKLCKQLLGQRFAINSDAFTYCTKMRRGEETCDQLYRLMLRTNAASEWSNESTDNAFTEGRSRALAFCPCNVHHIECIQVGWLILSANVTTSGTRSLDNQSDVGSRSFQR